MKEKKSEETRARLQFVFEGLLMECIWQIFNSSILEPAFSLPSSFRDVQVEVIVLPVPNNAVSPKPVKQSAFGILKDYANPALIPEEKGAWERAVGGKYGNH